MTSLPLLLLLRLASQGPESPSITLDNGNTVQLCGSCSSNTVRVAVTARHLVLSAGERPLVIEVSRGNVRQQQWRDWVTASWETEKGVPVALMLDVNDSLAQHGTYDVVLMVRPAMDRLKLQIVHPAAQLEVPERLLIERVGLFPGVPLAVELPLLTVRETTGLSKVSRIAFSNRKAVLGEQGVSGRLLPVGGEGMGDTLASATGVEVPAGQPKAIPYTLSGKFPFGSVTGVFQLIAPQLSQPVTVNYVVRTRVATPWVLLPVIVGLVVGFFVRFWLQQRIVLREAQRQALAILQLINERLARYDGTTRADIQTARQDLEEKARGTEPVKITESAKALEDVWKEAVKAFEERYQAARKQNQELERLLGRSWRAPVTVTGALEAARQLIGQVAKMLTDRRADDATTALDTLMVNLTRDLRQAGLDWQRGAGDLVKALAVADQGIPEPVRVQFQSEISTSPPELGRITAAESEPDADKLGTALSDLEFELAGYTALLESLGRRTDREWLDFEATWKSLSALPKPQALADLKQRLDGFVRQVLAAAPAPGALLKSLVRELATLQEAWATGILVQLANKAKEREAIRVQIEARQFVQAGKAMAEALENTAPGLGVGEAGSVPAPWIRTEAATREGDRTWFSATVAARDVIPGLPAVAVERDLFVARITQTILVGLLMAIWAFSFYAKTYDGTPQGLLAPFFATLLFDISVEGLKTQVKA